MAILPPVTRPRSSSSPARRGLETPRWVGSWAANQPTVIARYSPRGGLSRTRACGSAGRGADVAGMARELFGRVACRRAGAPDLHPPAGDRRRASALDRRPSFAAPHLHLRQRPELGTADPAAPASDRRMGPRSRATTTPARRRRTISFLAWKGEESDERLFCLRGFDGSSFATIERLEVHPQALSATEIRTQNRLCLLAPPGMARGVRPAESRSLRLA